MAACSRGRRNNAFIIASGEGGGDAVRNDSEGKRESWSDVIFEGNNDGAVYATPTIMTDATIPTGKTLVGGEGVTLTNEGNTESTGTQLVSRYDKTRTADGGSFTYSLWRKNRATKSASLRSITNADASATGRSLRWTG